MKIFILLITIISFGISSHQYTFLVNEYDKEINLEAKIISNIAKNSIKDEIKLFIPNISLIEKKVYSKYFTLTEKCEDSNFIFVKKSADNEKLCSISNKLFFTNNYKKLLSDKKFFGAFFWNKSRPNIVFIKARLNKKHINLPKDFEQFIEDFDDK
ncbi:hypothetical protein [Arcobacter sp.]|uniref:hypothetical protein n=1 Tax=Arcobacter sp. TaxID=1872629 RepID=UPI003D0B1DB7